MDKLIKIILSRFSAIITKAIAAFLAGYFGVTAATAESAAADISGAIVALLALIIASGIEIYHQRDSKKQTESAEAHRHIAQKTFYAATDAEDHLARAVHAIEVAKEDGIINFKDPETKSVIDKNMGESTKDVVSRLRKEIGAE